MRCPYTYIYPLFFPYIPKQYTIDPSMNRFNPYRINTIQIKINEMKYKDEYIKENLKYPEVQGLTNKEVQDFINNSIKNDVMEFKRQMEETAKEYGEEAKRNGEDFVPFVISSIYDVTYNKNDIISISLIYHQYINSLNSYIQASYNFDISNGRSMSLKDLFKEGVDYQKVINKEIRKELLLNKEKYFPNTAENFEGIAKYHPFYIENGDIVVYFGFHEIAPIASQIPIIRIPFSSLRSYVKPKFLSWQKRLHGAF